MKKSYLVALFLIVITVILLYSIRESLTLISAFYMAISVLICSFLLGLAIAINPYLFIPMQVVKKLSLWGDPSKQPGLVIFTMKSKGTLTANYPIDVEVEIKKSKDVEPYFLQAKKMEIIIPDLSLIHISEPTRPY